MKYSIAQAPTTIIFLLLLFSFPFDAAHASDNVEEARAAFEAWVASDIARTENYADPGDWDRAIWEKSLFAGLADLDGDGDQDAVFTYSTICTNCGRSDTGFVVFVYRDNRFQFFERKTSTLLGDYACKFRGIESVNNGAILVAASKQRDGDSRACPSTGRRIRYTVSGSELKAEILSERGISCEAFGTDFSLIPTGNVAENANATSDCPTGTTAYVERWSNGNILMEGCRKGGKRHGPSTQWTANGERFIAGSWNSEYKDGDWTGWWPNGRLRTTGTYTMGRQTGRWVTWSPDGTKTFEGDFNNNKPVEGSWTCWDENTGQETRCPSDLSSKLKYGL